MNTPTPTHYELLGVDKTATPAEIKTAWRKVLQFAHPDKGAPAGLFRSLEMAYNVLADEHQRAVYDRSLAAEPAAEPSFEKPVQPTEAPVAAPHPQDHRMTKDAPAGPPTGKSQGALRIRPGFTHGLLALVLALAADAGVTWVARFPLAAAGSLALAVAANLRFRDIRAQLAVFAAAAVLAGLQFGQHWRLLIGATKTPSLTHLGIIAAAHVVLAVVVTAAGFVYGQTLRLNRILPRKTLAASRVFGKRGGGRHWANVDVALETARVLEQAMAALPAATVLHGLRVMNGDEALFVDHALLLGDRIVLIQGAQLGAGRYTGEPGGHYLHNGRYFANNFDELSLAAAVVKKSMQRRVKISTLVLVIAADGVDLDAPGMVTEGGLQEWLVEHFGGLPTVIDRVVLRGMAAHLLP